tara:strand:+ start:2239 stop:2649 length:411 start_codon:yes stop_codon:yes gene_type:complete
LLKNARKSSSYTSRAGLANDCGITGEIIRRYEIGKALPSNQSLIQILKVLDIDKDSKEGREFITAVYEARESRPSSEKRAYGISANQELSKYISNSDNSEEKVEQLLSLFLEHVSPARQDESFLHFLRIKIIKILE